MDNMEEESTIDLDKDYILPCGHTAYKGKRAGMWVSDEPLGWCMDCGCMFNAKVLRSLIEQGVLEDNNTAFIKKKQG